ncbi:hypothetical protein [Lactovum odontotermitis]
MDIVLLRKRFSIYGFFNIASLFFIIGAFLVGLKAALVIIGHPLQTYMLMLMAILLSSLPDVSYLSMSSSHKKMMTYFKDIPLTDVQSYYLYRKFALLLSIACYIFFPITEGAVLYSLLMLTVLGFYTMITTSAERIFKLNKARNVKYVLKYGYAIGCIAFFRGMIPDFSETVQRLPLYSLVAVILLQYGMTYFNIRKIYEKESTKTYTKARYRYFKDINLLYIFRTELLFNLIIVFLLSMLAFKNQVIDISVFSFSILTSLVMIYYELLKNEAGKIQIFYKANHLKKIRMDKFVFISKFSIIYLIFMLALGWYHHNILEYLSRYLVAYSAFAASALFVKINIERKIQRVMISAKDMLKIIAVSLILVITGNWLLSTYVFI